MGLTSGYSSAGALRAVPQRRYQTGSCEHSDGPLLGGVDDDGVAGLVAQNAHDAIPALVGVLHDAFVATDHKCHVTNDEPGV